MYLWLLNLAVLTLVFLHSASAGTRRVSERSTMPFRVAGELKLSARANGFDGRLEILVDSHLPLNMSAWEYFDSLRDRRALRNACLAMISQSGDTISTETL